jgi:hypothetical protein
MGTPSAAISGAGAEQYNRADFKYFYFNLKRRT